MSLPKEVIEALDSGSVEADEYRISDAWDGWLIYKNLIDTPTYRKKFFPYSKPQDPIIAEPIASSIINRLASALRKGTTYSATINGTDATDELNALIEQLEWHDVTLDSLVKTLATGGQLFWLSIDELAKVRVDTIQPYYAGKVFSPTQRLLGFYQSFAMDSRTMLEPIDTYTHNEAQNIVRYVDEVSYMKWQNNTLIVNQPHNLPFIPAVWTDSIDFDEDGAYGMPYINRFKSMLLHLNSTLSKKQKALIIYLSALLPIHFSCLPSSIKRAAFTQTGRWFT